MWAPPGTAGEFPAPWEVEQSRKRRETADELALSIKSLLADPYIGLDMPKEVIENTKASALQAANLSAMSKLASAAYDSRPNIDVKEICLREKYDSRRDGLSQFQAVADAIFPGKLNMLGAGIYNAAGKEIRTSLAAIDEGIHSHLMKRYDNNVAKVQRAIGSTFFITFIPCKRVEPQFIRARDVLRASDRGPPWWIVTLREVEAHREAEAHKFEPDPGRLAVVRDILQARRGIAGVELP